MTAEVPATPDAFQRSVASRLSALHPGHVPTLFNRVFGDVVDMFAGRYLDYQAIDTPYHDLTHTLVVTSTFLDIAIGRAQSGAQPALTPRLTELGLIAALLHDTGYLKLRSDLSGTGAKYTFTHVLRSCAVASSFLPTRGVNLEELETVLGAIRCTSTSAEFSKLHFSDEAERVVGLSVATADLVGQMSQPNYLEALPKLFAEFAESDDYAGVPMEKRTFRHASELVAHTPVFWEKVVKPKLEGPLNGLYQYLARPAPNGRNAPLEAIEANVAKVRNA